MLGVLRPEDKDVSKAGEDKMEKGFVWLSSSSPAYTTVLPKAICTPGGGGGGGRQNLFFSRVVCNLLG